MSVRTAVLLLSVLCATAHPFNAPRVESRSIADAAWHHPRDHPVSKLFARQEEDGPEVGTPEWQSQYPAGIPSEAEADIPPTWLAAYNAAKAANKIPNIPVAAQNGGFPGYGNMNPADPAICQSSGMCRAEGDIWEAPDGHVGLNFDDGPSFGTTKLLDFLANRNQTATMYLIGANILQFPQQTVRAFEEGHELACHTWSHLVMSAQTDYGILVQLGWNMQIISDLTEGRVPKYWRPPTGDMDNRVRAIAREVFGLTPVLWNFDSQDWTPGSAGYTPQFMTQTLAGPKSPGVIMLEHELTEQSVDMFINYMWPGIQSNNWIPSPIAALFDLPSYQNADDNEGDVTPMTNLALGPSATLIGSTTEDPGTQSGTAEATSAPSQTKNPRDGASHHAASSLFCLVIATLIAMFLA